MEITYTPLAVERMMQRVISPQEVELLLGDPDGVITQSKDKFVYYQKIRGRKDNVLVAVAVQKRNNLYEVVTVMVNFEIPI